MQDCLLCVGRSKDIDTHYKGLTTYIKRDIIVADLPFAVLKKYNYDCKFCFPPGEFTIHLLFFPKYQADRCVSH